MLTRWQQLKIILPAVAYYVIVVALILLAVHH